MAALSTKRVGDSERVSVTVVTAGTLAMALVLVLATADIFRSLQAVARAQTAADAAALAAAQEMVSPSGRPPREPAGDFAARNGANLLACRCEPGTFEAVVEVGMSVPLLLLGPWRTVHASARAVVEGSAP